MKRLLILALCLAAALLALAGCGAEKTQEQAAGKITLRYPQQLAQYGFTEPLVLDRTPERVVSLVHTPVLALHELGITQVAVPENKMFAWLEDLTKNAKLLNVAMNDNFDIESIVALEPDLVILGYHAKDTYGKILEGQKIPVYYADAGHIVTYQSVKELTEALLDAFGGNNGEGAARIKERFAKLEERMAEKRKDNAGKKVMVLQSAPPRHFIQTDGGTLGSMAALLGYENVYKNADSRLVLLDREQALSYDPDLILCVGASATGEEHQKLMEADFAANPEYWNSFRAIRKGHVAYLPVNYVASSGITVTDQINALIDILEAKNL